MSQSCMLDVSRLIAPLQYDFLPPSWPEVFHLGWPAKSNLSFSRTKQPRPPPPPKLPPLSPPPRRLLPPLGPAFEPDAEKTLNDDVTVHHRTVVSSAELFYLSHSRSCAASAGGASSSSGCAPLNPGASLPKWFASLLSATVSMTGMCVECLVAPALCAFNLMLFLLCLMFLFVVIVFGACGNSQRWLLRRARVPIGNGLAFCFLMIYWDVPAFLSHPIYWSGFLHLDDLPACSIVWHIVRRFLRPACGLTRLALTCVTRLVFVINDVPYFASSIWCRPVPLAAVSTLVQADGAWQIGLAISVLSTIKLGLHLEPFRCRVIGCFLIFVLFPASTAQRILMAIAGFLLPSFPHDPAPYDLGATFHHGGTLATGMAFRPNAGVMPSSNQGGRPAPADLQQPRALRARSLSPGSSGNAQAEAPAAQTAPPGDASGHPASAPLSADPLTPPPPSPVSAPARGRARWRSGANDSHDRSRSRGRRWHCPVTACPCADSTRHRGWASLATMSDHLNAHLSHDLVGNVSSDWLASHNKARCRVCGLVVAASRGVHTTCRARDRAAQPPSSQAVPPSAPAPQDTSLLPTLDDIFTSRRPTFRHVPHRARRRWAVVLTRCLAMVALHNTVAAWTEFLLLPKCVLCVPFSKGSKSNKRTAAAYTLDRLSRWEAGERAALWADYTVQRGNTTPPNTTEAKNNRAMTLCREGMDGKSCSALTSGGLAKVCPATRDKLESMHPPALAQGRSPVASLAHPPDIPPELVARMLRSFPAGTAPGPSGLRAQHLLDSLSPACKTTVIEQLASVTLLLAQGAVPECLSRHLAGAKLFAADKKDGGVRPIAVGEILRRLTAKCLCHTAKDHARRVLWPLQVGCGSPLGAEVAIHVIRQWCTRNASENKVLLKIDFKNAFNTLDRQAILREVREHFPELARWSEWCYANHSNLIYEDNTIPIPSAAGVQQGDPLGPLLFSLAIHPLVRQLAEQGRDGRPNTALDLVLFYLDDGVLCGTPENVSRALLTLTAGARQLGLDLNLGKCELVVPGAQLPLNLAELFPRSLLINPITGQSRVLCSGNFDILGAPIGSSDHCAAHTCKRIDKARPLLTALEELPDPQIALRLLRRCLSFAKLVYSARTVPPSLHSGELTAYDDIVRNTFAASTSVITPDANWALATRGFWCGGLGLRSAAGHAGAAYVASCAATRHLCREVDPGFMWEAEQDGSELRTALDALNARLPASSRVDPTTDEWPRQQALSKALDQADHDAFFNTLSQADKAALLSEMLPGASGFIEAIPSKELDLAWEPVEFTTELRTRLLLDHYPADAWCPLCDVVLDTKARHCAKCASGGDRVRRHNGARNVASRHAEEAGANPELEKPDLLQPCPNQPAANRRRPADVYLPNWFGGTPAALDFAITSPHRQDISAVASTRVGAAAEAYELYKRSYLGTDNDCRAQGIAFIPMIAETSGGWGPAAMCTIKRIAKAAAIRADLDPGKVLAAHLASLCTVIRRANARAVLRRSPEDTRGRPPEGALTALAAFDATE